MVEIAIASGGTLPLANLSKMELQALTEHVASMEATTLASLAAINGISKIHRHTARTVSFSLEEALQELQSLEGLTQDQRYTIQLLTDLYLQTGAAINREAFAKILSCVAQMPVEPDNRSAWERFVDWLEEPF